MFNDAIVIDYAVSMMSKCPGLLTGGEDGGDDAAPLGPGDGLQPDGVLCGGAERGHAVGGGSGAQDHLLQGATNMVRTPPGPGPPS